MSPAEAAKLLELPENATPDQIEVRYNELRQKLEDKVAKAPTPGLRAKYRESIDTLTTAFETLTLAADSSALPVLRREKGEGSGEKGRGAEAGGGRPEAGGASPSPSSFHPSPAPRRKSGGMEFVIVAVIAVAVLGAGGWWVLKVRAENAEKARIAAEAKAEAEAKAAAEKAEAERKAAEEKRFAEEKRLAEEAEKVRLAAEEKAEQERLNQIAAQTRVQLAEAKIAWEVVQRELRMAEQALSELKSEQRLLRDPTDGQRRELESRLAAQAGFTEWLAAFLPAHPARLALARVEEFLNARQAEQAAAEMVALKSALAALPAEIRERREHDLEITGTVRVESVPTGLAWTMTDAFGRTFQGTTPATVARVAPGPARLSITNPGWPVPQTSVVEVRRKESVTRKLEFKPAQVVLESQPSGATVTREGQAEPLGTTPLTLADQVAGTVRFRFALKGHHATEETVTLKPGESHRIAAQLRPQPWPEAGQNWTLPGLDLQLIWVEPGEFVMGAPESETDRPRLTVYERPQMNVILTNGYWLGKFEVSVAQWQAIMGAPTALNRNNPPDSPAYAIGWSEAVDFCQRLTRQERQAGRLPPGYVYALPTEAQWEYACRAGTTGPFPGDPERLVPKGPPDQIGRGSMEANPWGFHDMHGSVSEWCRDAFNDYPGGRWLDWVQVIHRKGTERVLRGGSWTTLDTHLRIRSASRGTSPVAETSRNLIGPGLRLALVRENN